MKRAIFLCENPANVRWVYSEETLARIASICDPECERIYTKADLLARPEDFASVEIVFSTWGMPSLTEEEIRLALPSLTHLFYAAGSVQAFARPFLQSGVHVYSAWEANGVPVAEYTVAQIILANKGYFQLQQQAKAGNYRVKGDYPGSYGTKIGLIGCGMIGSMVAERLKAYRLQVLAFDPFLSEEKAERLGVEKVDLETLFASCQVVSNHLANNPQTKGMLRYAHFASMPPYATFLNTGRGAQVVEEDLARVLSERSDLTAVLDVTFPEPPRPGHPFYDLPNCFLTPHIAGSLGDEVKRMSEYMAKAAERVLGGGDCSWEVTLAMLQTMA